jgi:hypothetical protein
VLVPLIERDRVAGFSNQGAVTMEYVVIVEQGDTSFGA